MLLRSILDPARRWQPRTGESRTGESRSRKSLHRRRRGRDDGAVARSESSTASVREWAQVLRGGRASP
ncbi:hypothetical protein [Streptomyces sp. NPDC059076]|uniref:hypothetical protein n=1 Tax=unclassified Streptomyces TaxID=2593676 RepID=UPI00367CF9B3